MARELPPMLFPLVGGRGTVVTLGELMMILELHLEGLSLGHCPSARHRSQDRSPIHRPRPGAANLWSSTTAARSTDPFLPYLRQRLAAFPGLTAMRLWRELWIAVTAAATPP